MKKFLKFLSLFFGTAFVIFLFLSFQMLIQNPFFPKSSSVSKEKKNFHYGFFLPVSNQPFFNKLKEGALDAAASMDCAVSFHSIDSDPQSFEMAQFSGFDGIGLYLYGKDESKMRYLAQIQKRGIPIVQIENEIIHGPGSFLIGTNNFDVGKGIGQLCLETGFTSMNMILVYSKKNPGVMTDAALIEMGIKSVLKNKLLKLKTEKTSLNPLDAEGIVYVLLRENPAIDVLVLTDPNDTLVAVQAIIDMNLVGRVQIIGFGDQGLIRTYIKKGLILGSIIRNPYKIGYSAVRALNELSIKDYTSAFIDTGITILEKSNP